MTNDDSIQALTALGFTGLEAEVYTALLREAPTTGYRVAQALGKPVANTYKAIESLEIKGAVLVDEGESRVCRAVSPEELLTRLARSFSDQRDRAARALAQFRATPGDDRVYQMRSRDQVFERARQMLVRAREVAVLDLFPGPFEALRPDVERALARGIAVALKLYTPATLPGADLVVTPRGPEIIGRWPGEWLNVVVDGAEHILAFLAPDGERVIQAVWSGSAYLSWVYHSALTSELTIASLESAVANGATHAALIEEVGRFEGRRWHQAPGYRALMERFGSTDLPDRGDQQ